MSETDPLPPPVDPPLPAALRWGLVTVASTLAAVSILQAESLLSANDRSRWCTVWSLVEEGSYQIDEIDRRRILHRPSGKHRRRFGTIDKVYHDGHFYSTKPPLYPTLVAGLYAGVRTVTGWNLVEQTEPVSHVILLLVNWLPWTIALVVLANLLERYARRRWTRVFLLVTAGGGTLLLPFLVSLNNHTVAATGVIFALTSTLRILIDGERGWQHFAIAGFFSAWAASSELPAGLFAVTTMVLLARVDLRRTLAVFLPLALIPLAGFLVTNFLATGGLKPFYAFYGTEKYLYSVDGIDSYWKNPRGIDKGGDSLPVYLLHCTVGHHGILSLSPVFLLTLLAWCGIPQKFVPGLKTLSRVTLLITLVVLGFYLSRTANYNYGGVSCALRWMLWMVPLWLVTMIPVLDGFSGKPGLQALAIVLLAVSTVSAVIPLENPFQHPWLFTQLEHWKWIAYP